MSETHNLKDLRIIQVLAREHFDLVELLKTVPIYWDPTESVVDIVKTIIEDARIVAAGAESRREIENQLRRDLSYMRSEIQALRLEKSSEKISLGGTFSVGPSVYGSIKGQNPVR